jgi:hypothetical protein
MLGPLSRVVANRESQYPEAREAHAEAVAFCFAIGTAKEAEKNNITAKTGNAA